MLSPVHGVHVFVCEITQKSTMNGFGGLESYLATKSIG